MFTSASLHLRSALTASCIARIAQYSGFDVSGEPVEGFDVCDWGSGQKSTIKDGYIPPTVIPLLHLSTTLTRGTKECN